MRCKDFNLPECSSCLLNHAEETEYTKDHYCFIQQHGRILFQYSMNGTMKEKLKELLRTKAFNNSDAYIIKALELNYPEYADYYKKLMVLK